MSEREPIRDTYNIYGMPRSQNVGSFVQSASVRGVRFGEIGRWLLNNHLETIQRRRAYDRQSQLHPVLKGAEAVAVSAFETIPWVGDGATLIEGIRGKTFDGLPLSVPERILYGFLSIPPPFIPIDLPARPVITLYHQLDEHVLTPLLLKTLGPEAQKEDQAVRRGATPQQAEQGVAVRAASTANYLIPAYRASALRRV